MSSIEASTIESPSFEKDVEGLEDEEFRDASESITRSTLIEVSEFEEHSGICIEEVSKLIPENVLQTFQPDESIVGENGASIAKTLYAGLSHALNGSSHVTAPVLYKCFEWLGFISVKPGSLKGNSVLKYRTYVVQVQILAAGHVLPWKIGREWRYSELRKILVDDVLTVIRKNGLEEYFIGVMESFPPKTWQMRNTDETALLRGDAIQGYVSNLLGAINRIMEERHNSKKSKRQRRKNAAANNDNLVVDSYFSGTAAVASSLDDLLNQGMQEIIELLVGKLLNIDKMLRQDISKLSDDLGALITAAPSEHSQVTKEFKLTPQQAL